MFSSSNSINSIAKNYINNYGDGSNRNIGLAGLVSDLEVAELNSAKSAEQAKINRDFEERMSNTAYQRAVADLKAAGLNPALLYSSAGQASTPAGISASGGNASAPHAGQAIAQLLNTVISSFGGFMLEAVRAGNTAAHARRGYSTVYTDSDGVVRGGMSTRYY